MSKINRINQGASTPRICRHRTARNWALAAVLMAGGSAWAAEPGWYVGGSGAYSEVLEADGLSESVSGGSADCLLEIPGVGCIATVGSGLGGSTQSSRLSFDNDTAIGLAFGRQLANGLRPELSLSWLSHDFDSVRLSDGTTQEADGEIRALGLMANLWYDLPLGPHLVPYLGGGIGGREIRLSNTRSNSDRVFGWQLGAGIGWRLMQDRLTLSVDYRYLDGSDPEFTDDDGDRFATEFRARTIGLGIRFLLNGGPPPDSDGDGVPDEGDACPGTPLGTAVDSRGCPLDSDGDGVEDLADRCPNTPTGTRVDQSGCPLDSDRDGVIDSADRCPDTPPGTPVDEQGCALPTDADGDGVSDAQDQCPDTAAGTRVMSNGCAVGQSVELHGVNFELDSARLTPNARTILEQAVATLRQSPGFRVEIQGHTDTQGSAAYNLRLSQRRAESVRAFLIERGVDAGRLSAKGFGESLPKTLDDSPEAHAVNRRVELTVLGEDG